MISVIVPVYNEEDAVVNALSDISRELENFVEYEIILVNDGSTDKTLDKVKEADIKKLKIITHIENLGYGQSLFTGIKSAKYDCIAIIDGDGSYPAGRIKQFYQYYPQYDMVVGVRKGIEYKKGIFKRLARMLFNFLAKYASGRDVPDVNSGLRIFKKDIVMKFQDSLCSGFSFTTTLTLLFLINHYYVKYVPIDYLKRKGKSKVKHFKDTLRAGQIIVEVIARYNPIKLFLLLAAFNSIFGIVLGIINHFILKIDFVSIFSAICAASFIPIFSLGLIAGQLKKGYEMDKGRE